MLRVKDVQIDGQSFRIGNVQFGPRRQYMERLSAMKDGKSPGVSFDQARVDFVMASLRRVDPAASPQCLDVLDDDDLHALASAIAEWCGQQEDSLGEPASP